MTDYYVRSTDGSDANSGLTWALAKATLAGAAAVAVAGDTVFVSQVHSETTASAVTLTWAGTVANPIRILCANDAAEPPTTLATTGRMETTGSSNITITGSIFCYGLEFEAGVGNNAARAILLASLSGNRQLYEQCKFMIPSTNSASRISMGGGNVSHSFVSWKTCNVRLVAGRISHESASFEWHDGGVLSGHAGTILFDDITVRTGGTRNLRISGLDLSNLPTTADLVGTGDTFYPRVDISVINCRLPASWTGTLVNGTANSSDFIRMFNSDNAATNYKFWEVQFTGFVREESTIVKTGGATDFGTAISRKMTSNANSTERSGGLELTTLLIPNTTVGSSVTATIDFLHDSLTDLTDADLQMDVFYMSSTGTPIASVAKAGREPLASAVAHASSAASWTTTGLTNPNKQKMSVSFTPQMEGFILVRVYLTKASYTVYVDPKPILS